MPAGSLCSAFHKCPELPAPTEITCQNRFKSIPYSLNVFTLLHSRMIAVTSAPLLQGTCRSFLPYTDRFLRVRTAQRVDESDLALPRIPPNLCHVLAEGLSGKFTLIYDLSGQGAIIFMLLPFLLLIIRGGGVHAVVSTHFQWHSCEENRGISDQSGHPKIHCGGGAKFMKSAFSASLPAPLPDQMSRSGSLPQGRHCWRKAGPGRRNSRCVSGSDRSSEHACRRSSLAAIVPPMALAILFFSDNFGRSFAARE
ncbi:hypothetical protein C7212DRAFT_342953 [Tuber magnatum]|uniref:Uncharacterized protein n=1 Tax=Tuber magnatum TaxID=42249 RepID=A0A317SU50_9PEZI|nr:hypothetical protein C7212DRAFT_342953 [Tuber magnatum]